MVRTQLITHAPQSSILKSQTPSHPFYAFAGFLSALRWANKMLNQKLVSILLRPKSVARGKASISATTLTVTGFAAESSMFEVGMNITGAGVSPSTWILARVSGKGGEGTYTVSVRQNVAETEIKGEFYLMNSIYTLMLQQFVLWWYWKDIMEFSGQMLIWLGADFDYLKGLRPIMIISVVIVFDATFVFTKGLGHFVAIVDTVRLATRLLLLLCTSIIMRRNEFQCN